MYSKSIFHEHMCHGSDSRFQPDLAQLYCLWPLTQKIMATMPLCTLTKKKNCRNTGVISTAVFFCNLSCSYATIFSAVLLQFFFSRKGTKPRVHLRNSSQRVSFYENPRALPAGSPVTERGEECVERAPVWIPDNVAPRCMACQAGFTVVRRRHHCRNCGKVFCGRCSGNSVPLPRYGHAKPVRVCNRCFLYQVTPFTVGNAAAAAAVAAANS